MKFATIGVLGGGQLGRMMAFDAQRMGMKMVVLDPDTNAPAGQVANQHIVGSFRDPQKIAELAQHNHEEMRSRFADFWLGFEKTRLNEFLERAGFEMESSSAGKGEGTLGCLFLRARRVEAKTASISRLKSAKEISRAAAELK